MDIFLNLKTLFEQVWVQVRRERVAACRSVVLLLLFVSPQLGFSQPQTAPAISKAPSELQAIQRLQQSIESLLAEPRLA
ncbi:MAG: hypothetical protein ABI778_12095, partial [Ignavibacteriota bacterium]